MPGQSQLLFSRLMCLIFLIFFFLPFDWKMFVLHFFQSSVYVLLYLLHIYGIYRIVYKLSIKFTAETYIYVIYVFQENVYSLKYLITPLVFILSIFTFFITEKGFISGATNKFAMKFFSQDKCCVEMSFELKRTIIILHVVSLMNIQRIFTLHK